MVFFFFCLCQKVTIVKILTDTQKKALYVYTVALSYSRATIWLCTNALCCLKLKTIKEKMICKGSGTGRRKEVYVQNTENVLY